MTSRSIQERDRLVTAIRVLVGEKFSSMQIADKVGLTRNVVIGLAKRANPPISFRSRRPAPPKPVHGDGVYIARHARLRTVKVFGRTCCWTGCIDAPDGYGKPYCNKHAREARGATL